MAGSYKDSGADLFHLWVFDTTPLESTSLSV